ncbi:hypothetical protein RB195_009504 [Necator americanus]|uniref:Reverse transcriptase domain-containing protein n=1 Tax=Necator americanus TaxID=51031 RepID=A0ABR1CUD1_NECAM
MRCGQTQALTIFVAYAPTSSYEEEEVEAFYIDLEKFYQEDHAFYKVIVGDFNAKVVPTRTIEELHIGTSGLQWNEQGERLSEFIMTTKTIHGNSQFQKPSSLRLAFCLKDVAVVPKFYTGSDHRLFRGRFSFTRREEKAAKFRERSPEFIINCDLSTTLVGFWEDSAMKAESFKTTMGRLSLATLELIRQRGAAAGNQELTSEFARLCREAIKEDLKERRAEVLAEAGEAGKSIRYARRDFASRKARMTAPRNLKGTIISRRGMEKIIYDSYSDLFDSHRFFRPKYHIMSVETRMTPGPDRIRREFMKNLPPVLINTLVLRELYNNFATGISPFYKNIIIDVKRELKQGDTISPKIFTATLENAMRKLEWDDMGVKADGRQLHHLRFADDIVLTTTGIS